MVQLLIISIHGMGTQDVEYYQSFQKKLSMNLAKHDLLQDQDYAFRGFHYSSIFDEEANIVASLGENLDWKGLRRFVIHYLGDALAYQKGLADNNRINYYDIIHDKLDTDLRQWKDELDLSDDTPVLILAHSLGAYIISNYIWDRQKQFPESNRLEEMGTLCGIVSFGCNIPILTLGFESDKLYPITLPGFGIEDGDHIKWINVYDRDDVLSLPLENFYSARNDRDQNTIEKIEDVEMNIGNVFVRWTPYSHKYYWQDKSFIKYLSNHIDHIIGKLSK